MNIPNPLKSLQSDIYAILLRYGAFALIGLVIFGAGIYVSLPSMHHGAFGEIIGTDFPSFAVKEAHEAKKIVLIGTTTIIRAMHGRASSADLHVGSNVVIIGEPDDEGRIAATLIRIMPVSTTTGF